MRIGFLTAACMIEGHPNLRKDYWEHELEFTPMQRACRRHGLELCPIVWDDPSLTPRSFDAYVIGTTWDYAEKPTAFLARLEALSDQVPLFNPLSVVRWNLQKTYLKELALKGVPVIPTLWRERADVPTIARAFDELGVDEIVVKPVVGASSWRQARLKRGAPLPVVEALPPDTTMIQPFLPAAAEEGEYAFVFFEGEFSHCAQKRPQEGDYRVQSMYGAREYPYVPSRDELALAQSVIDAIRTKLLYARVDMMRTEQGQLALMELELIEPYLYPDQGPGMGESFARALLKRLNEAT